MGWMRVAVRGSIIVCILLTGLMILLSVRLVERPLHGLARPWSPRVVQGVSRLVLRAIGLSHRVIGTRMRGPGALVSNHASWLDIFALNARKPVTFVSKSEVAGWPGIGFLASAAGSLFIDRDARRAAEQKDLLARHLRARRRLVFFPEGTSTDGMRVLPFKTSLFGAFFMQDMKPGARLQPVTIRYRAPASADPRAYAWWGDMGFGGHALQVLARHPQGMVTVHYHPPLDLADWPDRKALALACERAVRSGMEG